MPAVLSKSYTLDVHSVDYPRSQGDYSMGDAAGGATEVDAEALNSENVYWIDYRCALPLPSAALGAAAQRGFSCDAPSIPRGDRDVLYRGIRSVPALTAGVLLNQ